MKKKRVISPTIFWGEDQKWLLGDESRVFHSKWCLRIQFLAPTNAIWDGSQLPVVAPLLPPIFRRPETHLRGILGIGISQHHGNHLAVKRDAVDLDS